MNAASDQVIYGLWQKISIFHPLFGPRLFVSGLEAVLSHFVWKCKCLKRNVRRSVWIVLKPKWILVVVKQKALFDANLETNEKMFWEENFNSGKQSKQKIVGFFLACSLSLLLSAWRVLFRMWPKIRYAPPVYFIFVVNTLVLQMKRTDKIQLLKNEPDGLPSRTLFSSCCPQSQDISFIPLATKNLHGYLLLFRKP